MQAFLQEPTKYYVRGLTRDTTSAKSKNLADQGVELVQADLDDANSLQNAFEGAHIIYAMTDFWQSMSATVEFEQGKRIVDIAAALPQLEHFVWASLPDGKELSKGEFVNIFHWQSKADVAKYTKNSKPALWAKTIEILFPNYFENCVTNAPVYLPVKVGYQLLRSTIVMLGLLTPCSQHKDGTYVRSFVLPGETPLPNAAISDTGKLVKYLTEHDDEYHKRTIAFNSQSISELAKLEVLHKGKRETSWSNLRRPNPFLYSIQHPRPVRADSATRLPQQARSSNGPGDRTGLHRAVDDL